MSGLSRKKSYKGEKYQFRKRLIHSFKIFRVSEPDPASSGLFLSERKVGAGVSLKTEPEPEPELTSSEQEPYK